MEQELWHSVDPRKLSGSRVELLEKENKMLAVKLREAELMLQDRGETTSAESVQHLQAMNEGLKKQLLEDKEHSMRMREMLLSTLERYRGEVVDKDVITVLSQSVSSLWPFKSMNQQRPPSNSSDEDLGRELSRSRRVRGMMQARIDKLTALLTGERQARRDAQHWCVLPREKGGKSGFRDPALTDCLASQGRCDGAQDGPDEDADGRGRPAAQPRPCDGSDRGTSRGERRGHGIVGGALP